HGQASEVMACGVQFLRIGGLQEQEGERLLWGQVLEVVLPRYLLGPDVRFLVEALFVLGTVEPVRARGTDANPGAPPGGVAGHVDTAVLTDADRVGAVRAERK